MYKGLLAACEKFDSYLAGIGESIDSILYVGCGDDSTPFEVWGNKVHFLDVRDNKLGDVPYFQEEVKDHNQGPYDLVLLHQFDCIPAYTEVLPQVKEGGYLLTDNMFYVAFRLKCDGYSLKAAIGVTDTPGMGDDQLVTTDLEKVLRPVKSLRKLKKINPVWYDHIQAEENTMDFIAQGLGQSKRKLFGRTMAVRYLNKKERSGLPRELPPQLMAKYYLFKF